MGAEKLLDRLQRVQKVGPNKWRARCPAHKSADLECWLDKRLVQRG